MSAATSADPTFSPAQILHALMLSCIYPLLQNQRTGALDPMMARDAAVELLKTFRVRDTWELFACTQLMGFGLAALDSLGLSMSPDLSPAMTLRCRSNANSLQRTSDRCRRALDEHRAAAEARRAREAALAQVPDLAEAQAQAAAQIAETERLLAAARARDHRPANEPPAPTTAAASPARSAPAVAAFMPPAAAPAASGYKAAALSSAAAYPPTAPA